MMGLSNGIEFDAIPYCSLLSKGVLDSFQKLFDTYGLEKPDFLRYLQIRTYHIAEIKPITDKGNKKRVKIIFIWIRNIQQIRPDWSEDFSIIDEEWLNMYSFLSTSTS